MSYASRQKQVSPSKPIESDDTCNFLRQMLASHPETRLLDLSERKIAHLDSLVEPIGKFSALEDLNLADNLLTHLPVELSLWTNVASLNLSNLNFADFEETIHALNSLPSLKSLYMNLEEEIQVDFILSVLPRLEFLNGLPVDREVLVRSEEESEVVSGSAFTL